MENIDDLTISYIDDDGLETIKELDKKVLTRGAWTTIMFLHQDFVKAKEEYGPKKVTIRRYQKRDGTYRPKSKFTISSEKQAKQVVDGLEEWFDGKDD
jgi:hypothetical protein